MLDNNLEEEKKRKAPPAHLLLSRALERRTTRVLMPCMSHGAVNSLRSLLYHTPRWRERDEEK